ncbi:hypothetical protein CMV30_08860 [Nibricoccus aquaticus]|uniref:Uncharacterized protein n=1 Tax=Nibricoccus aquaticus TaxID=2576891 RepID=A0A290QI75_9BACT|nr:hypothetical protein CMV30_08860 [Nibricoccus aquaticus]
MWAAAGLTSVTQACGPDFPNRYLDAPEGRILASPEAVFANEVERIASCGATKKSQSGRVIGQDERVDVETAYRLGREAAARTERCEGVSDDARREAREEAVKWFGLTRALVEAGAKDEPNLARESIGWEAFAELHTGNFIQAITLYLRHHREGDDTAINSLRFVMRRLFRDETWRKQGLGEKLAQDVASRQVWTAWLIAQGSGGSGWDDTEHMERVAAAARIWAELLNKTGVCDVPEADRFAWVAYQGGNFVLAREWVRFAPADSGVAEWLRGKLALRAGDLAGGERHLRAAAGSSELAVQRPVILGELGRVFLAKNCGVRALEAWMSGGHWEDAAYVAERVLSLGELRAYVDRAAQEGAPENGEEMRGRLRHLLARRLMRANRDDDTVDYFSEELRVVAREYAADVRMGFDLKETDAVRAAAFWRAAKIARERGMELLGTELEPDWAIWGGSFETGAAAKAREELAASPGGTFATTKEELERVMEHAVPEQRFHYRYRAAQLAWWAAGLMPNDAEETAAILSEAGGWLKNRDPQAAKAFYQALAIRCGRTELGRRAAERRWFADETKAANP